MPTQALLFASLDAGALLVRDRGALERAFRFDSSYLPPDEHPLLSNFMDSGPELSRSFRAFKVWCALRAFGVGAHVDAIERILDLARHFERRLQESDVFELLAPVTLTAVCFRPKNHQDGDCRNLVVRLREEGTALVGPVVLRGRTGIRACIANYRTTVADIDLIVDRLVALSRER
jgi:aromatic-L-amino-acid decarboxylase